ncbi:MAG: hypothetical protein NC253_13335 [Ruminococcus sp.]|nr:hypothetical protein [Ruminococcus sp.]MCM1381091.1 hypothetical protein [Muribaculaceae bacterium]MCM1478683.1 hypothetical protein [Muribaculaceae bacterium]
MGLFSPNQNKLKQIELQNIIFGTEEKKLMVSPEFLDEMTKAYVTKRMKNVNKMSEFIVATKSPRKFFTAYDALTKDIDELIVLEKYHEFKKPVPHEFKQEVDSKVPRYTENMINRAWKDANKQNKYQADGKRDPELYGPFLDEMLEFKDRYSSPVLSLIDGFYQSVYDDSFLNPKEPEVPEEETEEGVPAEGEAAEGAENAENAAPEGEGDGFVEEEFVFLGEE